MPPKAAGRGRGAAAVGAEAVPTSQRGRVLTRSTRAMEAENGEQFQDEEPQPPPAKKAKQTKPPGGAIIEQSQPQLSREDMRACMQELFQQHMQQMQPQPSSSMGQQPQTPASYQPQAAPALAVNFQPPIQFQAQLNQPSLPVVFQQPMVPAVTFPTVTFPTSITFFNFLN